MSGESKLKELYAPDKTAHDLFDMVYSKEEVTSARARIQLEVLAISRAYEDLRKMNVFDACEVLAADDQDRDRIEIQEITTAFAQATAPHIVSKIVLRSFIERPGLLIDDNDAAARLGLNPNSFEAVVDLLVGEGLLYGGIFSSGWRRWWSHRLEAFAARLIGAPLLSLTATERAGRFREILNLDVRPAVSPWNDSDQEYVAFACASCRRPTEMRHSLAAFDPKSPKFTQRRRICWDCIQSDQYLQPPTAFAVDETDEDLVADIKNQSRKA
ncbi:hypothetical protein D3C72_985980 [compost metagenome]